ncbi:short chain dehydrogenase [Coprinopsis cinerea okayama7|uniref:Short chain dehydrogenase n=1 Tax=Coprinopsis cinerea (strain Okayama-7 / 130 / ATCC MYA-4618 / FGSC 9003) TaxID=240176 RepID=A8PEZ6_COPC7|nr:short chain dehydrogenase [Coprinopsis cinerea okayama7\|eukprot:XP_001840884.1 short chain dehydrogenase [Coprinopsis cinerea okayama7\
MSTDLVWLITGTSSGIGRDLALAALARGDKVIATARGRTVSKLEDLKAKGAEAIELDVTAPLDRLHEIAKAAVGIYGRIDVLVNNAGYMLVGAIEANTPEETFEQFNTNVFGALNVARAFLPYMRERRSGMIMWMGSIGGWQSVPYGGLYATTKWALRGISETLSDEVAPFGINSVCIDLGYFRTPFLKDTQHVPPVSRIADYQKLTEERHAVFQAYNGKQPGDPLAAVQVLGDLAHGTGTAAGKAFPRSLNLGSDSYQTAKKHCEDALARLEGWRDISISTDFEKH